MKSVCAKHCSAVLKCRERSCSRTCCLRSRLLGRRQRRIELGRIPDELIRHRGRDRVRARAWLQATLVHGGASGGHIRRRQRWIELRRFPDQFVRFRCRALSRYRETVQTVSSTQRRNHLRRTRVLHVHRRDCRRWRLLRLCLRFRLPGDLCGGRTGCGRGRHGRRCYCQSGSRSGNRSRSGNHRLLRDGSAFRDCAGWLRLADAAFRHVIDDARIDDGRACGFIHGGRDFCHCAAVRLKEHQVRGPCCTEQEPSNNHQNLSGIHHTY